MKIIYLNITQNHKNLEIFLTEHPGCCIYPCYFVVNF